MDIKGRPPLGDTKDLKPTPLIGIEGVEVGIRSLRKTLNNAPHLQCNIPLIFLFFSSSLYMLICPTVCWTRDMATRLTLKIYFLGCSAPVSHCCCAISMPMVDDNEHQLDQY
jgi:hypothetical protein